MRHLETGRTLSKAVGDLIGILISEAKRGTLTAKHLRAVFYAAERPLLRTHLNPGQHETWYAVLGIPERQGRVRVAGHRPLLPEHVPSLPALLQTLGLAAGAGLLPASDPQAWVDAVDRAIADLRREHPAGGARFPDPGPLLPKADCPAIDVSLLEAIRENLETTGWSVIGGATVARRAAVAHAIAQRIGEAGRRVVAVDARTRLGFGMRPNGSDVPADYARLWADIFVELLDTPRNTPLSSAAWQELDRDVQRLLKTATLSRDERAFLNALSSVKRAGNGGRVLRDGLRRYGDGLRTPDLAAAIALALRGSLAGTLIVIHEAQPCEAAAPIAMKLLGGSAEARHPADVCLLLTSAQRHGFSFFEAADTAVHDLETAAGAGSAPSLPRGNSVDRPASRAEAASRPDDVRPARRLKRLLDARARQSALTIALEAVAVGPTATGPQVQIRRLGPRAMIPVLLPGPYHLCYATSLAPPPSGVCLLLLEHDRNANEWILVNAIADAQLPLDRRKPASGVHDAPFHLQAGRGTFDLYAIASAAGFGNRLHVLAEGVAGETDDGTLADLLLDDLAEALIDIMAPDRAGLVATARFTYRVDI